MDASQLWYLEILHFGPKHEFFIFYLPRVCEMLRNFQTSFWVQWTRMDASQLWYPEIVIRARTQVLLLLRVEG
jgi:hypothetical protein